MCDSSCRPRCEALRASVVVKYVPFQGEMGHVGPWTAVSGRLALGPRRGEIGANVPIPPGGSGTSWGAVRRWRTAPPPQHPERNQGKCSAESSRARPTR